MKTHGNQKELQTEWTVNQMMIVTGMTRQTIVQRLAQVAPKKVTSREKIYGAPACFRAVIIKLKGGAPAERLALANANRAERKDLIESGEVIRADTAGDAWLDLTIMFRQRALSMGNNLESQGKINHEQRLAIDAEVNAALLELKKEISSTADKIEMEEK